MAKYKMNSMENVNVSDLRSLDATIDMKHESRYSHQPYVDRNELHGIAHPKPGGKRSKFTLLSILATDENKRSVLVSSFR